MLQSQILHTVYQILSFVATWPGVLLVLLVVAALLLRIRYRKGLRKVPGPFLASILPFDRLLTAATGRQQWRHIDYHERYGPFVRVGPNHVSISRGDYITQIYGIGNAFPKSRFYTVFDAIFPDGRRVPSTFSIRDEKAHKSLKRPVANAFSMTSLVELEPMTDDCIKILEKKLDGLQNQRIDLGTWLHWYAFDVITSITFSNRQGFMENETDVDGIINAIEGRLLYNSVIGEVPSLHNILLGNKFIAACASRIPSIARLNSTRSIVRFAATQLERYTKIMPTKAKSLEEPRDILARLKRIRDNGESMSEGDVLNHAAGNIFAGSDTTAISLRSMFYYLCKNKRCYDKLVAEIDQMNKNGELSDPITYGEASRMEYLQACMKEAMRIHPAVGQLLERIIPEGGAIMGDVWLPGGTIVGINPWVVGREKSVYGDDVDEFRPERWLDTDPETSKAMLRNFLAFGSGGRTCLGKNISLLEMAKLVPQLLRDFEIDLFEPAADWSLSTHWFVKQTNFFCRVRRRDGTQNKV